MSWARKWLAWRSRRIISVAARSWSWRPDTERICRIVSMPDWNAVARMAMMTTLTAAATSSSTRVKPERLFAGRVGMFMLSAPFVAPAGCRGNLV